MHIRYIGDCERCHQACSCLTESGRCPECVGKPHRIEVLFEWLDDTYNKTCMWLENFVLLMMIPLIVLFFVSFPFLFVYSLLGLLGIVK